jgi:hypothetical protein
VEELRLGDFRFDFLHLERRIDDLEEVLAKTLSAAAAETKEERLAALDPVDELPTIPAHRKCF